MIHPAYIRTVCCHAHRGREERFQRMAETFPTVLAPKGMSSQSPFIEFIHRTDHVALPVCMELSCISYPLSQELWWDTTAEVAMGQSKANIWLEDRTKPENTAVSASNFELRSPQNNSCAAPATNTRVLTTEAAIQRSGKVESTSPGGHWGPGGIGW